MNVKLNPSWKEVLSDEFEKTYFQTLKAFLVQEIESKQTIYPPPKQIFNALDHCSFDQIKVVILGQDPYHGPGQAHGLCFSVADGVGTPPSLQNIFKELQNDLGLTPPSHGNLIKWANQGVLLLNATLTVRRGQPTSHAGKGWETFTDKIIQAISDQKSGVVFLLWGKYAQNKGSLIDASKHHILKAAHPSPFSAHSGFFGCKHFSQANQFLEKQGQEPIDWEL